MEPEKKRILCVDDDESTCTMMTILLGRAGYNAVTAQTFAETLRLAQSEQFDLYILDNRFADRTGVELCQQLRDFTPSIPIVFYSGATSESERAEALSAGAQAYIIKPAIEELLQTIRAYLHETSSEQHKG